MNEDLTILTVEQLEQRLNRQPFSPLFARLAGEYLNQERIGEAKQLCIKGLLLYPNYSTAKLIYESCLRAESAEVSMITGDESPAHCDAVPAFAADATGDRSPDRSGQIADDSPSPAIAPADEDSHVETVGTVLPVIISEPVFDSLGEQAQAGAGYFDTGESEAPATSPPETETADSTSEPPPLAFDGGEQTADNIFEVEDDGGDAPPAPSHAGPESPVKEKELIGQELPQEISIQATLPRQGPDEVGNERHEISTDYDQEDEKTVLGFEKFQHEPYQDERPIVSRTLAEIYASQGEFKEAIETYSLLVASRPDRKEEFENRIVELEHELKKREQNTEKKPR